MIASFQKKKTNLSKHTKDYYIKAWFEKKKEEKEQSLSH